MDGTAPMFQTSHTLMCSDSVRNVELVVELAPCLVMVFDVLCMSMLLVLDGGLQVALELGVLPCFLGP